MPRPFMDRIGGAWFGENPQPTFPRWAAYAPPIYDRIARPRSFRQAAARSDSVRSVRSNDIVGLTAMPHLAGDPPR